MSFPIVLTLPCRSFGSGVNDSVVIAFTLAMIPLAVRLDHLCSVAEINLVAVIIRGVVTRGDDDAGACFEITNRKGKLRHRARAVEHARVAAIFSCNFRRNFGELFRKKARIMRDHELRLCRDSLRARSNRADKQQVLALHG